MTMRLSRHLVAAGLMIEVVRFLDFVTNYEPALSP
jgi:hypothetical protein